MKGANENDKKKFENLTKTTVEQQAQTFLRAFVIGFL